MSVDAAAADRLPWLADEPPPQPEKRAPAMPNLEFALAAAMVAFVAAGGFWIGARSLEPQSTIPVQHPQSSTTVLLPSAAAADDGEANGALRRRSRTSGRPRHAS